MKNLIINSIIEDFNLETEVISEIGQNPTFSWAKLIVCDDSPNANKMRVPEDEFNNLIKTGIFTPVKMARGKISGHEDAYGNPIGVITQMKKEDNTVKALAAFWKREREEDINYLKEMKSKGELPQVSWEIAYDDAVSEIGEDGIQILRDVSLVGVAIVASPAYKGRTPIYELASDKNKDGEMEKTIQELQAEIEEKDKLLSERENLLKEKDTQLQEKEDELVSLREFKTSIEKEAENLSKMDSIKKKFEDAGITKDSAYFEDNRERLLKLEEGDLDFLIQEILAFSSTNKTGESEELDENEKLKIPLFPADKNNPYKNPRELARALKESRKSKKE